jgi:branched-chain amino acid transport system substrate-binding protein
MVAAAVLLSGAAHAQISGDKVKIGVLTDMSRSFPWALAPEWLRPRKWPVEDFGGKINTAFRSSRLGDHQSKPDVATSIASRWYDADGVNVITDVGITSVAFAVVDLAKVRNKTVLLVSTGSDDFTEPSLRAQLGALAVRQLFLRQLGRRRRADSRQKWFMLNADYAFGRAMEAGVTAALKKNGAEVVGSLKHARGQ